MAYYEDHTLRLLARTEHEDDDEDGPSFSSPHPDDQSIPFPHIGERRYSHENVDNCNNIIRHKHDSDHEGMLQLLEKSGDAEALHPLAGLSAHELEQMGLEYVETKLGMLTTNGIGREQDEETRRLFALGARIAAAGADASAKKEVKDKAVVRYSTIRGLKKEEKEALESEVKSKWNEPFMLYFVVAGKLAHNRDTRLCNGRSSNLEEIEME